jgi:hypothetical protein
MRISSQTRPPPVATPQYPIGHGSIQERSFVPETHWLDNDAQNFQTSVVKNPDQLRCGLEC